MDERLQVGDGAGRCGKHPLELRPAAGAEPCLHSRRYRQIFPLVSGGLPGVLLDRTLRTIRHRAAKGEPVEVQYLQLTGLCPEHGAGAPSGSAGIVAAGSGSLLLAELAGGKAAGDRGKRSGCAGAGADRPAAYRWFCRGTGRKAEPDRGAAASQK